MRYLLFKMRRLIREILLKEEVKSYKYIEPGNIYKTSSGGILVLIDSTVCKNDEEDRTIHTMDWGDVHFYHDGCYIKYKVSRDEGETWVFEQEPFGHEVETGWVNVIIERGFWIPLLEIDNDIDFFPE